MTQIFKNKFFLGGGTIKGSKFLGEAINGGYYCGFYGIKFFILVYYFIIIYYHYIFL